MEENRTDLARERAGRGAWMGLSYVTQRGKTLESKDWETLESLIFDLFEKLFLTKFDLLSQKVKFNTPRSRLLDSSSYSRESRTVLASWAFGASEAGGPTSFSLYRSRYRVRCKCSQKIAARGRKSERFRSGPRRTSLSILLPPAQTPNAQSRSSAKKSHARQASSRSNTFSYSGWCSLYCWERSGHSPE